MDSSIPQKRPSSPLIPTDPVPSSSSKELQDATSDPTIKGFKVPKQFRNWEGQPKVARVMGGLEASYLDTKLEVDDSNEYEESLLAFEALIAESAYPTRQHIRSLLALCLFPLLFKPPTRISQFAKATQSSSSAATKPVLHPFVEDPFEKSHKKIRESALGVLGDLIETNGVGVVCRSIKGYGGLRKRKREQTEEQEDPFALKPMPSSPPRTATKKKGSKGGKTLKAESKPKLSNPDSSEEEDLELSDGDDVLAVSAKRMGNSENLWDFLAGTTARKPRVWKRENPVVEGGWEVLRSLVEGWENEAAKNTEESHKNDTEPKASSMLRYFKPSATASDTRELSSKALDTAFWPFSDFAQSKMEDSDSDSDADSNDDGSLFSDDEDWGKGKGKGKSVAKGKGKVEEEEVKFKGGMNSSEKKEVGIRLLALIGECATNGHLDGAATLSELTQRMKALDHESFASFLDSFSLHTPSDSPFLPRLLSFFLETHSHPLSATTSLTIPSIASLSSSTLSATSSSDLLTSPRKRALAAQNSLLSVNGDSPASQSHSQPITKSKEQVSLEFWRVPNIGQTDFLVLLSRIPIEVTLPQTASTGGGGGGRKPKPIKGNFARAQKASECHQLVKEVLLQCKVENTKDTEMREKEFGRIREVLEDVERVVEESRDRMK